MNCAEVLKLCPRCGKGWASSPEKPQLFLCANCGFQFFFNVAAAVAVLLIGRRQSVVWVVRAKEPRKGLLDLPGGFVEQGETLEEAAQREVKEELGVDIGKPKYLCSYPNIYHWGGLDYMTVDSFMYIDLPWKAEFKNNDEVDGLVGRPLDSVRPDQVAFDSMVRLIISHSKTNF